MAEFVKVYTSEDMKPENLSKNPLTVVDFWATWCGPCRMLSPIIEELAAETPDVAFGKIDVDQNMDIANAVKISAVPTVMIFKNGELVERITGVRPKEDLKKLIDAHR